MSPLSSKQYTKSKIKELTLIKGVIYLPHNPKSRADAKYQVVGAVSAAIKC
jgi:hypothetical protein